MPDTIPPANNKSLDNIQLFPKLLILNMWKIQFGFWLRISAETKEITARAGESIQLQCPVDISGKDEFKPIFETLTFPECGEYHSLEWYRDSERVFVYGPNAGFENAEDGLMDRWVKWVCHYFRDCEWKWGAIKLPSRAATPHLPTSHLFNPLPLSIHPQKGVGGPYLMVTMHDGEIFQNPIEFQTLLCL